MLKFVYDRKINNFFVPNCYPIEDKFYDNIESFVKETGKEPIVHPLFRDLQEEKFLIDDVERDFIYPIEQFGAIDKLIGQEDDYKDFCFLHFIKKSSLNKIKNNNGKIVVLSFEESRIELNSIIFLHNKLVEFDIDKIYYITGNNWSTYEHYKTWCKNNGLQIKIVMINSNEQLYLKGQDLYKGHGTFVNENELDNKREKRFLCFNRRIRPHRYAMIAMFHHNNLLKDNLVSYSLERGKDLNHLGEQGPDLHTMNTIMGKTILRDSYMSYYNELVKLSPMTIDYENLSNVMGPGHENKEPYLKTYFSIVTETPFPERNYFLTEKIYRPMIQYHPFIVYGSPFTLKNLKELGFKTFSPYIDESYDETISPFKRMQKITKEIKRLCGMSDTEIHEWFLGMKDILIHNRNLMYNYGREYKESQMKIFEDINNEIS